MPLPTPRENEEESAFIQRCVPLVIESEDLDADSEEDRSQAVAICYSQWRDAQKGFDMGRQMEHKTFPGMVVKADEEQGIVDAFFAVFGNVDEGQDVMHPGAFAKTFSERGNKVRVLDNHRTDSIMRAIGKPVMLKEVGRDELPGDLLLQHPDATGGAFASIQMLMDTPEGRGAFIRLRDKAVTEWSFGYDPIGFDFDTRQDNGREVNVRNLREVKLYEVSPVLFAMNEATTTVGAKGASGATNLPIADRQRAWDATAAVRRVRAETGSEEEPSRSYRNAFFWFDGDVPENFGSYKLPFADVVDGRLMAIPRGVFASAAVVQGSRGGVDIPAGDVDAVKSRINRYYARMRQQFDDDGIVAPWEKSGHRPAENKAFNLGQRVNDVISSFYTKFPDTHNHNHGVHVIYWVKEVWDEFIIIEQEGTQGRRLWKVAYSIGDNKDVNFQPQSEWLEVTIAFVPLNAIEQLDQAGPDSAPPPNARPDDAPPTEDREKALRELHIMAANLQLSEVNDE